MAACSTALFIHNVMRTVRKAIEKHLSAAKAAEMDDSLSRRHGQAFGGSVPGVKARDRAFTLIELLVVIAIIAILASVLLPVLRMAQLRGQEANCINNQHQMSIAWQLYASDNHDSCIGNFWSDEKNHVKYENWLSGWLDVGSATTDNTNTDLLVDPAYATLGDYTKNPKLYLCPSSVVTGPVNASVRQPICRTVSMNCWVGYTCQPPTNSGTGPKMKIFNTVTSITAGISPVDLFVFVEERGESIDDGSFETQIGDSVLANWATDYHDHAATFGFADGHADTHRWRVGATWSNPNNPSGPLMGMLQPQETVLAGKWGASPTITGNSLADYNWLSTHATCHK